MGGGEWRPARPASDWTQAHPAHGTAKQVEMVSFGVDPQWGGLLFSLCSRHEDAGAVLGAGGGGGLLFPSVLSDPLAASASSPGLAADLVSLTGSGCLDFYSVSSVWAIVVQTAKATGMVVLLGVGSLIFYRVYHSIWPRLRRRLKALRRASARAATPPAAARPRPRTKSLSSSSGLESDEEASDDGEDESIVVRRSLHHFHRAAAERESAEVTGMYFGPVADSNPLPRNKAAAARRTRRRTSHTGRDTLSLDEEARDADVSEGSRSPRTPPEVRAGAGMSRGPAWWRGAPGAGSGQPRPRPWRGAPCSTTSSSSSLSPEYPPHSNRNHESRGRRHRPEFPVARAGATVRTQELPGIPDPRELVLLRREDSTDSLARRFLTRDESFESLCSYSLGQRRRYVQQEEHLLSGTVGNPRPRAPGSVVFSTGGDDVNSDDGPVSAPEALGCLSKPFPCDSSLEPSPVLDEDPAKDVIFQRFMNSSRTSLHSSRSFPHIVLHFQCGGHHSGRSLSRDESMDSLVYPRRLPRNESMDSLGFPRRNMTRGSSFDSTCSELSLDASLIAELEAQGEAAANEPNPTLACLEHLQREIEQLKSNCLSLDEEFESFKCNRNLPGMSSLLEAKVAGDPSGCDGEEERARAARARACFAGLYSLTRITSSPSLDLSDCQPSSLESGQTTPPHLRVRTLPATEEAPPSLEWDEELAVHPLGESMDLGASAATILQKAAQDGDVTVPRPRSLDTSCVSLRDSDSMLTSSVATYELDLESELGEVVAPIRELEHEDSNKCEEEATSPTSPDSWPLQEGVLTRSSSSSGVSVLSRSLSGQSDAWCSAATAIGPRVSLLEYARREWQGDTGKANTILRGYAEVPALLGLHALRVVRGDNYCSVRGALFQALSRGLPLPPGHQASSRCAQLLAQPSGHWLRAWNFAGRLPYSKDNVEDGIRDCLLSLDSTVERLQSAVDRETTLANLLNADPWLDARLCEAAKLLMIINAVELRTAADRGQPLPLFAELLFARDSSSNPRDFMNNHLKNVGDTAGLEQVEMYLLGYSLGVRIRVVRPSAFGSPDYVCCYPDSEDLGRGTNDDICNQKFVDLVAEDDRHYNVLVQ